MQLTHNAHPPQFNEGSYCEPNEPSDPPRTSKRNKTRKIQSQKDGIKFEFIVLFFNQSFKSSFYDVQQKTLKGANVAKRDILPEIFRVVIFF